MEIGRTAAIAYGKGLRLKLAKSCLSFTYDDRLAGTVMQIFGLAASRIAVP
jgi:hypothetical protein